MVSDSCDESEFDLKIIQALADGGRAWNRLMKPARHYALAIIRRRGGDLAEDLHEEVVQQALLNLFRNGRRRLDPNKGAPSTLFGWCVREAIRQVRVSMLPPGNVTRKRGPKPKAAATVIPYEEVAEIARTDSTIRDIETVENRVTAAKILMLAPRNVARGLELIHYEDATLEVAARAAALSRFQLSRRMLAFGVEMRAAA